jgi:hypothetical protein
MLGKAVRAQGVTISVRGTNQTLRALVNFQGVLASLPSRPAMGRSVALESLEGPGTIATNSILTRGYFNNWEIDGRGTITNGVAVTNGLTTAVPVARLTGRFSVGTDTNLQPLDVIGQALQNR